MSAAPGARTPQAEVAAHWRHLLLLGVVAGLLLTAAPPGWTLAAAAAGALVGGWARAGAAVVLGTAVAVLAGAAAGDARLAALDRSSLGPLLGRELTETIQLDEVPRRGAFGATAAGRLRGEPVLLRTAGPWCAPRSCEATGGALPGPGTRWRVRGTLRGPSPFARARGAHAELRVEHAAPAGHRGGWPAVVDGVRARAQRGLEPPLPAEEAALLRGMVLGDDSALPDARRDELRASGLGHLVAASGQNVALLAALGAAAGALLGVPFRTRVAAILLLVALYVPLAGAGPSIQRAGVMAAAALIATLAGRAASRWYALGAAAAATLLLDPRAAGDPGWQLSFAAVLALLLLARPARDALRARGVGPGLAEAVAVTAVAGLATAPVAAAHFGVVSLASLPANVLVAPAVAPITWLGMLGAVAGQADPLLGAPFAWLAAPLLAYVLLVGETAAGLPHATVGPAVGAAVGLAAAALLLPRSGRPRGVPGGSTPGPRRWGRRARVMAEPVVVVAALGLAWLGGAVVWPVGVALALRRRVPAAAVVLAAAAVAFLASPHPPPPPERLRVTFIDVGQGDATLVQDRRHAVLVDAGVPGSGIEDRLAEAGVDRLDLLVVTHADADHAGGVADLLAHVDVDLVLDGRDGVASAADAALRRRRTVSARAGQALRVGDLVLRVLSPSPQTAGTTNDRAVVLVAEAHGRRVLLPADAESDTLLTLSLPRVDVLKVSHHGSEDPGLPTLLQRTRPRLAGIEVGVDNRYGHPTASTLRALEPVPAVVRTDRDGTVRADLEHGRWVVRRSPYPAR